MTKKTRQKAWYLLLTKAQLRWSQLSGHLPFFQLAIQDYQARIKRVVENTSIDALFTEAEITRRRNKHLAGVAKELLPQKTESAQSIDHLAILTELTAAELFTRKERRSRLSPMLKQQRQEFRKEHRRKLTFFGQYEKLVSAAPSDEIDTEILELQQSYEHFGRMREWFTAYAALAEEAVVAADHQSPDIEYNENPIRLLQRDFLTTMRTRLITYRRLGELRAEAFLNEDRLAIRLISYFKFKADMSGTFVDSSRDFAEVNQFLAALEYQMDMSRNREPVQADGSDFDHVYNQQQRLHEWQQFKQAGAQDFNALKRIASQCQDWQRDMELFQSETEVSRLENDGSIDNQLERVALDQFIESLSRRIEAEIENDIAFQQIISHLIISNEHPDALHLTLEQLKLARSKKDSPELVARLKSDFVGKYAENEEEADVIPLFRK